MVKLRSHAPIEVSSSPEPEPTPRHKRTRTTKPTAPVIELTDSDSETNAPRRMNAVAGPSSRPIPPRQLQPKAGGSNSIEIIPHRKVKATASRNTPLFLSSDEENNPFLDSAPRTPAVLEQPRPFPIDLDMDMELQEHVPLDPPAEPQPQPAEEAEPDPDPQSTAIARILEIVPDVEPDYLLVLVTNHMLEHPDQELGVVVEHILHALFEHPKYPKVDRMNKGKRKQTEAEVDGQAAGTPSKKTKIDYADKNRPFQRGVHYTDLALEHLQTSFPYIPKAYIRTSLTAHNGLYAPTHLFFLGQEKTQERQREANENVALPYNRRVKPYRPKGKGSASAQDDEFEAERKWLVDELAGLGTANANGDESNDVSDGECEDGIECGCCFSTFRFDKMVQCPETHLFCTPCMTSYASTLLGTHDPKIKCMDQSGCTALIPASELRRFLSAKLMELWERVQQRKEVEAAGLEGLEECPFCEWGCVIENPEEKLLRCGNTDGCGVVSCRGCKKPDHLPKSCKEMEEDKHLDGRHAVEEAMTQALMRNCPKCQKPFIKESGCNKMSCPNCHTLSCYVCRSVITGYDHFDQAPAGQPGSSRDSGKCLLWDAVEQRHAAEVKAAADHALEEYKRAHPDVNEKDIKVDLPVAPPAAAIPGYPGYHHINYAEQLLRNAQAALDAATADYERLHAAEGAHRTRMLEREADIRLLDESGVRMPDMAVEYAARALELKAMLGQDQARWYQMRVETQNAQMRMEVARGQVDMYQRQQAPALNVNVNVNMYGAGMGMGMGMQPLPMPVLARPVAPRRVKARAPARRRWR